MLTEPTTYHFSVATLRGHPRPPYSTVVAVQQLCANPLNLVSNVDMRSLTGAASGPLAEVGSEDDDEQNCPAASGIGVYLFD